MGTTRLVTVDIMLKPTMVCALVLAGCSVVASSALAADTCMQIGNIKGQSAYGDHEQYKFGSDGMADTVLVFCHNGEHGKFANTPAIFTRFGDSTWIWFNEVGGHEVAEVWMFDLSKNKALFARTKTSLRFGGTQLTPPTIGAFVGDIL